MYNTNNMQTLGFALYCNSFLPTVRFTIALLLTLRPWSLKPVIDVTGWYFFPVIFFLSFPDKFIYPALINWPIGNALMKPITDCKQQEQDYRQKMSACNVSYRLKRSGHKSLRYVSAINNVQKLKNQLSLHRSCTKSGLSLQWAWP